MQLRRGVIVGRQSGFGQLEFERVDTRGQGPSPTAPPLPVYAFSYKFTVASFSQMGLVQARVPLAAMMETRQ